METRSEIELLAYSPCICRALKHYLTVREKVMRGFLRSSDQEERRLGVAMLRSALTQQGVGFRSELLNSGLGQEPMVTIPKHLLKGNVGFCSLLHFWTNWICKEMLSSLKNYAMSLRRNS